MGNNGNKNQDKKGCLIAFTIIAGFVAMMATSIYLAENNYGLLTLIPFGVFGGVFLIFGGYSSIKEFNEISKKRKNKTFDPDKTYDANNADETDDDWQKNADLVDKLAEEFFDKISEKCDDDTYDLVYEAWNEKDTEIIENDDITSREGDKLCIANTRKYLRMLDFYADSMSEEEPGYIHISKDQMSRYMLQDDLMELCDTETFDMINAELSAMRDEGVSIKTVGVFQALIDSSADSASEEEPGRIHITQEQMSSFLTEHGVSATNKDQVKPKVKKKITPDPVAEVKSAASVKLAEPAPDPVAKPDVEKPVDKNTQKEKSMHAETIVKHEQSEEHAERIVPKIKEKAEKSLHAETIVTHEQSAENSDPRSEEKTERKEQEPAATVQSKKTRATVGYRSIRKK